MRRNKTGWWLLVIIIVIAVVAIVLIAYRINQIEQVDNKWLDGNDWQ